MKTIKATDLQDKLNDQLFGLEVEMLASKPRLADVISVHTKGKKQRPTIRGFLWGKEHHVITDQAHRNWYVKSECLNTFEEAAELVTPILTLGNDREILEKILTGCRDNMFIGDPQAGVHVNIDGKALPNEGQVFENPLNRFLANYFVVQDFLHQEILTVNDGRFFHCEPIAERHIKSKLRQTPGKDSSIPLGLRSRKSIAVSLLHYKKGKGRIELRPFNSTHMQDRTCTPLINKDAILAYTELSLALSIAAQENAKLPPILEAGQSPQQSTTTFLESIGLFGDDHKETRSIFVNHLPTEKLTRTNLRVAKFTENYQKYTHGNKIV